jgi:phosphoglycerate kinase
MIQRVLSDNSADSILTSGLVGQIFMMADGIRLGEKTESLIKEKGYEKYIQEARKYLGVYREKIVYPKDIAYALGGKREENAIDVLPVDALIFDIGEKTIKMYSDILSKARTIFVNGPAGIYEEEISSKGTVSLWKVIENVEGFTIVGGGDTVTSFTMFTDISKLNYVSTAGGALILYLSGVELPLINAMTQAFHTG